MLYFQDNVHAWLAAASDQTETPVTDRRPDISRPKVSNKHVPRRHSANGCRPIKLFTPNDDIVIDEVEKVESENRYHLEKIVETVICDNLWKEIKQQSEEICYGFSVDHPSQKQHDWCLMATDEERIDMFLDFAFSILDINEMFDKTVLEKCRELNINVTEREAWKLCYEKYISFKNDVAFLKKVMLKRI